MFLAVDVGNSSTVLAVYSGFEQRAIVRLPTERSATSQHLSASLLPTLQLYAPTEIAIASVVPSLESAWRTFCQEGFGITPCFLRSERESGLKLLYDPPSSLGIDRLCNAVAGAQLYGTPCIVIDFGTATKLEAVSRERIYLGGAILPGLEISAQALLSRAEKIRDIDWTPPERAIGQNTMEALRSGFVFGFVGQAEALLLRFQEEIGEEACVVTTGGLAPRLLSVSPLLTNYNPNLTLEGVRLLYPHQREK